MDYHLTCTRGRCLTVLLKGLDAHNFPNAAGLVMTYSTCLNDLTEMARTVPAHIARG